MCTFANCTDIISSSEFTKLHLTFKQRILAWTLRLLLSWVQQQEILGGGLLLSRHIISISEEGPESFTRHSNKLGRWEKNTLVAFSCLIYLSSVQFVCFSPLAAPFCLSFYLDLVKTPTGALIWSFLKPMVLGKILYTPDTIETRAIMEKVWLCLQYIRISPLKRFLVYLAWACFFEKWKSVFWLFGVLVKLSFPSCIAGHMSQLLSLNESYLQKIAVGLLFIIRFFLRPSVYELSPPCFQPVIKRCLPGQML